MPLVDAENLNVGGVESLRVEAGDWVDIRWPCQHAGPEEKALIRFLKGRTGIGRVQVPASVAYPWIMFRRRFPWIREARLGSLRRRCAHELLEDWDALASEFEWGNRDTPSHLPGNPKALMSILLAMSESKLVLFTTAGLDPCGASRLEAFVDRARGRGWAFLRCTTVRPENGVEVRRR